MGTTNTIATAIGSSDQIINNEGGSLNNVNTVAQLGAATAGLGSITSTAGGLAAITAGEAAFSTGSAVLAADIQSGNSATNVISDLMTLAGDAAIVTAGVASQYPGGSEVATIATDVGDASVLLGVGIRNWDAVTTNAPIAFAELMTEFDEFGQSVDNFVEQTFPTMPGAVVNAVESAAQSFDAANTAVLNAIADLGTSAFNSAATTASNAWNSWQNSFTSEFSSTGFTPLNITDTVTNNAFTITGGSAPSITGNASFGSNGTSTGLNTTGNNGGINTTETDGISSTEFTDSLQGNNPNGTGQYTQTTTSQSNGQVVTDISGQGDEADSSLISVVLSNDTLATLRGKGDSVTAGNSDTLTIDSSSSSNDTTDTGTSTTITDNGTGDTVNLQGNSSSATMGGAGAIGNSTGNNNNLIMTAAGAQATESGSGDSATIYANNATINASGSGDGSVLEGNTQNTIMTGVNANANLYGSGDSATQWGNNATINASGTGDGAVLEGNTQNAIMTGASDNANLHGSGDSTTQYGNGATVSAFGNDEGAILEGNSQSAALTGSGDYGGLHGTSDSVTASGASDTANLDGSNESANLGGSDDLATLDSTDSGTMTTAATGSEISATSVQSGETVNIGVTQSSSGGTLNFTDNASGSGSGTYNLSGSSQLTGVSGVAVVNDGTDILSSANLTAGGSVLDVFNPDNDVIETAAEFTGVNDTGELSAAAVGLSPLVGTSGITVDDFFTYNGSGVETEYQEDWSIPTTGGTLQYFANYTPTGGYINGDADGGLENSGSYGDGGEFELASGKNSKGINITSISQFDSTLPQNSTALAAAQTAWQEVNLVSQAPTTGANTADQALYEGGKWDSNIITWSLGTLASGTAASPFSSYMGSQYAELIQQAFQAWGAASGLTFEQVSSSSHADINIGWGDFNTASSGVVGYTTYPTQKGQFQPGVIIRLEDPSQDPILTSNSSPNPSATQAYLYEVILHEIGHALGLADNNDPNSVMYYQAGASDTTLDSTDIGAIQTLYSSATPSAALLALEAAAPSGSGASINSMLQQLIQANASFLPAASTTLSTPLLSAEISTPTLVTPGAAHS
jgi:Matrixin